MVNQYISTISGRREKPRNSHYAGQRFPLEKTCPALAEKYSHGVWFTEEGFPDFTKYIVQVSGVPGTLNLNDLSPLSRVDTRHADDVFGIDSVALGLIWYHVPYSQGLILIPRDLHDAVLPHSGGRDTNGPWTPAARAELKLDEK